MAGIKEFKKGGVSRRDFIKGTGYVVGGAAISSSVIAACAPAKPAEKTPTGANETTTTTSTKYVCPYDNQQFNTLDELKAHLNSVHGGSVPGEQLTKFTVNGTQYALKVKDNWSLADVLRRELRLTGTKVSCNEGICGFCTVVMDGRNVDSCLVLAAEAAGANITTVEALDDLQYNLQQGFIEQQGFMCGFCTPGQIMSARALLLNNKSPTRADVKQALSGNICMCMGYELIADSALAAAQRVASGVTRPKPPTSNYATAAGGGA